MNLESDKRLKFQVSLDFSSAPTGEARQAGWEDIESLSVMSECKRREQKSLSEATELVGCAGVKIRHLEALCLLRQRARDEASGTLCEGSIRGSDRGAFLNGFDGRDAQYAVISSILASHVALASRSYFA